MSFSQVMHHHSLKILEQSKIHFSQLFIIIIRKVKRKGVLITKFNDFKYHAEVFKEKIGTSHSSAFKADSKEKQTITGTTTNGRTKSMTNYLLL